MPDRPPYPDIPSCAISRKESDLLADLTTGGRVLEIGSWLGYSTVWMALNGAVVVAVDPHEWQDTKAAFRVTLRRYGVEDRVTPVYLTSQAFAADPGPGGAAPFDAAFIDGDHSYEVARHDLLLARRLVKPGGWIIAHDYAYPGYNFGGCPEVVRAVDEVLGDLREVRREHWVYAARLAAARTEG